MKENETNTSTLSKKKKIVYSVILAVCVLLLVAATVLTVYFVTGRGNEVLENPNDQTGGQQQEPGDPSGGGQQQEPSAPSGGGQQEDPTEPSGSEGRVLFIAPIASKECSVEYRSLYNNRTLDKWIVHKAVDYAADEGTDVLAMSDGTVVSISLDSILGNLVEIEHAGNLRTVYRFIEPEATLKVGDAVKQGQKIGEVASAYGTEYKDGTHLHLEMTLNGESVDPADYIDVTLEEK